MGYPENHGRAPLISRHMNDLLKKPVSAVVACLEDPNTEADYKYRKASKSLSARAVAARYVMKAIEGSASHGAELLDRTEGKVASTPETAGQMIQFNFNLDSPRQVGDVMQQVIEGMVAGSSTPGQQVYIKDTQQHGVNSMTVPVQAHVNPMTHPTRVQPLAALDTTYVEAEHSEYDENASD